AVAGAARPAWADRPAPPYPPADRSLPGAAAAGAVRRRAGRPGRPVRAGARPARGRGPARRGAGGRRSARLAGQLADGRPEVVDVDRETDRDRGANPAGVAVRPPAARTRAARTRAVRGRLLAVAAPRQLPQVDDGLAPGGPAAGVDGDGKHLDAEHVGPGRRHRRQQVVAGRLTGGAESAG